LVTLRLLAVHAHPDDESSKGSGTYAYYRSRGARVMVVSCTGGERGSILNAGLAERLPAERDLPGLRRIEMARAREILDVEHRWLGYADSGMPDDGEPLPHDAFAAIPLESSAEPLVKIIREYRPHVLVTYDENGGYPHPDHIRTHEISIFAREAAADPARYPDAGEGWHVPKLYYDRIFNPTRIGAVYDHAVEHDPENPFVAQLAEMRQWMSAGRPRPDVATTHIQVGDFLETRDAALRAHASQVEPDTTFFFWPNDLQRAAWPFEDFQLIDSLVETELPESDLFAGIVDDEAAAAPSKDNS
jgi:mycothiol S-conjugate amidase